MGKGNFIDSVDKETLTRARKYLEYKTNPILFVEEQCMLPAPGGDTLPVLYPPQRRIFETFFKEHHLILLKSRQIGFSTLCQLIVAYVVIFYDNVVCGVLSRSSTESSDFCRKTEDIIDKIPSEWLKPTYKTKSAQSFILENGSQLWSSAISQTNPGSVFRGKSISILIIDEAAHIFKISEAWTGIAPALSKAQDAAAIKRIPFGTVFLSTPNKTVGIGKFFYDMWTSSISGTGANILKPFKIHWTEVPEFKDNPNWYKKQCQMLNNESRRIAQELELKFISSGNTLFSEEVQSALQSKSKSQPLDKILLSADVEIWLYSSIDKRKFHLIGVDTASEAGRDYSTIEVFTFTDMEQVMEFKGKLAVKKFVKVVKMIAQLVPHNVIIVESNSYGNQVIEELRDDEEVDYNLFGEYRGKSDKKKFYHGLSTNVKTRPLIVDALFNWVNQFPMSIKSERLALELLALSDRTDRVEAEPGSTDDLCMSMGFCCYARQYCRNSLGNTDSIAKADGIDDAAEETMDATYGTALIKTLIGSNSPLADSFSNENYDTFKKDLDRYVNATAGLGLVGPINVFELFKKTPNSIWEFKEMDH